MVVRLQAEVTLTSATMGCTMSCAEGNLWSKKSGQTFTSNLAPRAPFDRICFSTTLPRPVS
jgi:hypothetical protein